VLATLGFLLLGSLAQAPATSGSDLSCSIQDAAAADQRIVLLCERDRMYVTPDLGKTWQAKRLPPNLRLRAVEFLDSRRGFVLGDAATLLATQDGGDTWHQVQTPAKGNLTAIQFIGEQGWITGYDGLVLHSTDGGKTWSEQKTGVTQALEGLYFADAQHGWAVGWIGTIVRTEDGGRTWKEIALISNSETSAKLDASAKAGAASDVNVSTMGWSMSAVYFRDAKNGWIVGFGGQILRSSDGGLTWKPQKSPVGVTLSSVLFDRSGRGWIAAGNNMLISDDGGESWKLLQIDDPVFLARFLPLKDSIWAIGQFGILRQAGDATKWERISMPSAETESPAKPASQP
jgi:photosystem II stability/assembly factor-like uncharacterized protein